MLLEQLHCNRNIHMYDFHDDAGHHHGSQCKQGIAFERQDPSLVWALLATLGHFFYLLGYIGIGKLYSFGLWAKFTKS